MFAVKSKLLKLKPSIISGLFKNKFYNHFEDKSRSESFSFSNYDCIGFDLDNTLARFNTFALAKCIYEYIANYLVSKKEYSSKYLNLPFEEGVDYLRRGLFLDIENSNVLQLDVHGSILKAFRGSIPLTQGKLKQIYGKDKVWQLGKKYAFDPLSIWNKPESYRLKPVLDYFDTPSSLILSRVVDTFLEIPNSSEVGFKVYHDLLEAYKLIFRKDFLNCDDGLFKAIREKPEDFYEKSRLNVFDWLKDLKSGCKAMFLITGSGPDFASHTAAYTLGENWRECFDVIVYSARKPDFFINDIPFVSGRKSSLKAAVNENDFGRQQEYMYGNWDDLYTYLKRKSGLMTPKIVYVGDNLIQDIYTPALYTTADCVTICEELSYENVVMKDHVEMKNQEPSKRWSSYFYSDENVPTVWAHLISKYSKICFPSIDSCVRHPVDFEFRNNFNSINHGLRDKKTV